MSTYASIDCTVCTGISVTRFGIILKVLGNFLRVYLVFGDNLILLWQKCYEIGQVFIPVDGLKL